MSNYNYKFLRSSDMNEIDKIIIHSLRQIGCSIDMECAINLASFTPDLLVSCVVACLQEIKPRADLPLSLPSNSMNLAQRFAVASTLAEACVCQGFRGDIGYQTFLYPNSIDVRRLFMFLIEQLPKGNQVAMEQSRHGYRSTMKDKVQNQLNKLWVPIFSEEIGHSSRAYSHQRVPFMPQLNLNICAIKQLAPNSQNYQQQHSACFYQPIQLRDCDVICSVLHLNAEQMCPISQSVGQFKRIFDLTRVSNSRNMLDASCVAPDAAAEIGIAEKETIATSKTFSPFEKLTYRVAELKGQSNAVVLDFNVASAKKRSLRHQLANVELKIGKLGKDVQMRKFLHTILTVLAAKEKLKKYISTAQERRQSLDEKWQTYRQGLEKDIANLAVLKKKVQMIQNVKHLRADVLQLENSLRRKTILYAHLSADLKNISKNIILRKGYICSILELVSNIHKQRKDVLKILEDTRELQKNFYSAMEQVQRQFNYTDDLLFQNAKYDLHTKKAYKLLISLHSTCNELVLIISQTSNITKEIRDLEVQTTHEKLRNTAMGLEKILADTSDFENNIKSVRLQIQAVQNAILVE